jgi:uncharacterized OB-fold protein
MSTDVTPPKPLPIATDISRPFWDGLREHRLRLQYSPSSQRWVFYPRSVAPGTLADDLEWRDASGDATLYTVSIAHRPTAPPWADSLPQFLAVVELAEGPRLSSELVGIAVEDVRIGMPLTAVFDDVPGQDVTLLKFTAAKLP